MLLVDVVDKRGERADLGRPVRADESLYADLLVGLPKFGPSW